MSNVDRVDFLLEQPKIQQLPVILMIDSLLFQPFSTKIAPKWRPDKVCFASEFSRMRSRARKIKTLQRVNFLKFFATSRVIV